MRRIAIRAIGLLLCGLLLFVASSASGGEFGLDANVIGQVRRNTNNRIESPDNNYFGLNFLAPSANLAAEGNYRYFRDLSRKINEFDIYQTVFHADPAPVFNADAGRLFIVPGFTAPVIDGAQLNFVAPQYVAVSAYSGIPRNVEVGGFHRDDGLLSGFAVTLKDVPGTNARLYAAWRRNSIHGPLRKTNDTVSVGANLVHEFDVAMKPRLYGLAEYDTTGKVFYAGTGGIAMQIEKRLSLNFEGNYFNVDRNSSRQTILGLIAQGYMLSARAAATVTIVQEWLDFVADYSYQRVTVANNVRRNGNLLDASFQVTADSIGLVVEPAYYFAKSFGGTLNGARVSIHEQFFKDLYASVSFDFSKYRKITNDNDIALSTIFWSGYQPVKDLWISGGFEYNRNNDFNKDIRGSFRVSYLFNHKTGGK